MPAAPSAHRTGPSIGALRLTSLSDGHLDIPAAYFTGLTEEETRTVTPTARFGANTWRIDTGSRSILVDAGSGTWLRDRFPASGALGWHEDGMAPHRQAVTDIIVTHMHVDHIGGLVSAGASLFPGAEIHVQAAEWNFWTDDALPTAAPEDMRPLVTLIQALAAPLKDQVRLHDGDTDLGSGIRLVAAPGHTPGHQIVHLCSGGEETVLLADALVSGSLQFSNPDIHYALDSDPDRAAATRRHLFEWLAAEAIPFSATHLATQDFGVLERRGPGFGFTPCRMPE